MLSFTDYLTIVTEDAAADVTVLQAKISQLQHRLNQATTPIQRQLQQLQQQLVQKQKQAATEVKNQNKNQNKNQQSTLTTPGSTGSTQPGSSTPGV